MGRLLQLQRMTVPTHSHSANHIAPMESLNKIPTRISRHERGERRSPNQNKSKDFNLKPTPGCFFAPSASTILTDHVSRSIARRLACFRFSRLNGVNHDPLF
jgi:hypothetical protein